LIVSVLPVPAGPKSIPPYIKLIDVVILKKTRSVRSVITSLLQFPKYS
jgi:hypothetical protein